LKVGETVDVLRTECNANSLIGWTTGVIRELTKENCIIISFINTPNTILSLPLSSPNIAPYGYYTGGNEWREELKEGSLIDCLDTVNVWYKSTVLAVENKEINGRMMRKVYVGFRRFESDADKTDSKGRPYNGWSEKYDELIDPYSLRIQKPDTIAKMGKIGCKKGLDEDGRENVDDTSDILVNSAVQEQVYAVLRNGEKGRVVPIVEMLNILGEKEGYENMLRRLENTENFPLYGNFIGKIRYGILLH